MNEEKAIEYINESLTEKMIRDSEDQTLFLMRFRQETFPCEKNDKEWLDYTNIVCRRRCQHEFNV
jgi:hypothetical protein